MSILSRLKDLEKRVKRLERPSAPAADLRAFILENTKAPIKARDLEEKAFELGFGKSKFRVVRAELAEEGKIELYREPYYWVWRRVAK